MQKRLYFILLMVINAPLYSQTEKELYNKADSLNRNGDEIYNEGNYQKSLEKYLLAYDLIKKTDSVKKETEILNNIGVMYDYLGEYSESLKYYLMALELCEREGFMKQKAVSYNNIGALYFFREKYKEALSYYELSLGVEFVIGDTLGIAQSYENIGIIYKKFKNYQKAQDYYLDALEIYKNIKYQEGISNVFDNLGTLSFEQKKYNKALEFYKKAYTIQKHENDLLGQAFSLNNMAESYAANRNFAKAEELYLESLKTSKKINLLEQIRYSYRMLSELYIEKNDPGKALKYYKLYTKHKDSVFNETKNKQFEELQTKYETEKKENKIARQELIIKKNKLVIYSTIVGLIAGFSFILILTWLYIQKHRAYKLLVSLNVELASKNNTNLLIVDKSKGEKYSKSSLTEDVKTELHEKIIGYMEHESPYLNKHFSIDDIAGALDTNKKYISRIINEDFETNFNNFINKFRVNHARQMLLDEQHRKLSLQGIAESSGFNTRATFISAFKKFAGVTPSYFIKESYKS